MHDTFQGAAARTGESTDAAKPGSANVPLTAGVIAGLAASACCLGPLVFVALGLGGAAAGLIGFFTPLRPAFIGLALLFLGFAAYRLFFVPKACVPGTACADPRTLRKQRLVFIGAVIVSAALVAFPWYVTYLA
ncbi:MAG: mercury transporter MerT [Betaproteobacteria bacterium]|nr:mercury transporter MerT [Betaproteobacteria bacterium]MBI2961871.1 mercury transporter MerT [Betaproteobacteria bacterium]